MKTVAVGKQAVIDYLEKDALQRTGGKEGVYRVFSDGKQMFVVIAGHTFSGNFTMSSSDAPNDIDKMDIQNGIVVNIVEK